MKEYSDLNHLSSLQHNHSKAQTLVHCCLQLIFLEQKQKLTPSSMLNAKTTSLDTTDKLKGVDEKYDGLLMLCDL